MKQILQLNLAHHLTLTPKLQQAIRLLQLSTLDLQHEIQQQVEANPLLEASSLTDQQDENEHPNSLQNEQEEDFQWSHLYTAQTNTAKFNENEYIYENLHCTTTTLQAHLRWQLDLTPMSEIDYMIATTIIDAINEDGFLTLSLPDLLSSLSNDTYPLDLAEIRTVIHRIQRFDPIGCASTDLAEALLIQLQTVSKSIPYLDITTDILTNSIDLLGQHNYRLLCKKHHINNVALDYVLHTIQHLNPKPGSALRCDPTQFTIPDLTVKKINNKWQVSLNHNTLPHLSINSYYASMIKCINNGADKQYLKNNLQEAHWFLKSIQSRQETLLKVARYIVDYQQEFLHFGPEAMKPLILNDVALALDMHESTISRVTTQKFIHTPKGLFELKYFFSSHVSTTMGDACSSIAIRALIKKLIAAEDSCKPLSDNKLTHLIGEHGIKIARRTVAKYREAMGVSTASKRKSIRS